MSKRPLTGSYVQMALLLTVVSISFSITPSFAGIDDADSSEFVEPNFFEAMKAFCAENPYDCKSNKIVTRYAENTMFKAFYLSVDKHFSDLGFTEAVFEYCAYDQHDCHVEGRDVRNSSYLITKAYPKRKGWAAAYGGINQNLGIYLLRSMDEAEIDKKCSLESYQGNSLSRSVQSKVDRGQISTFSELIRSGYRGYTANLVRYVPHLFELGSGNPLPADECWLFKNSPFNSLVRGKKIVFRTKPN